MSVSGVSLVPRLEAIKEEWIIGSILTYRRRRRIYPADIHWGNSWELVNHVRRFTSTKHLQRFFGICAHVLREKCSVAHGDIIKSADGSHLEDSSGPSPPPRQLQLGRCCLRCTASDLRAHCQMIMAPRKSPRDIKPHFATFLCNLYHNGLLIYFLGSPYYISHRISPRSGRSVFLPLLVRSPPAPRTSSTQHMVGKSARIHGRQRPRELETLASPVWTYFPNCPSDLCHQIQI